jgi:hypothetical protein
VALAFIGAGSKDDILSARGMMAQHANRWTVEWLRAKGLPDWAEYLDKLPHQNELPVEGAITFHDPNRFQSNGKLRRGETLQ